MSKKELTINNVDVSNIINRNEERVAKAIPQILNEYYSDYIFQDLDIQDIYALSLNLLPGGYAQTGSIVLSNRLSNWEISRQIRAAVERVLDNPTRSEQ